NRLGKVEMHSLGPSSRPLLAIDCRRHRQSRAGEIATDLLARHKGRTEGAREVLALHRPKPDWALGRLHVAQAEVVEQGVASDGVESLGTAGVVQPSADDDSELELVV